MKRLFRTCLAVVGLSATLGTADHAVADQATPDWCTTQGDLWAAALPAVLPPVNGCELTGRIVRSGGYALEVPPPGTGIDVHDVLVDGHAGFSIDTLPDGTVLIGGDDEEDAAAATAALGPVAPSHNPCTSAAAGYYSFDGHKVMSTYSWQYLENNAPASHPQNTGMGGFVMNLGATTVVNGYNDCGITAVPNAPAQVYAGITTGPGTGPQVVPGGCGTRDSESWTGWVALETGVLGRACTWRNTATTPYTVITADIAFNTNYEWMNYAPLALSQTVPCVGALDTRFDLQSVATHEFGHVYGLGHAPVLNPGNPAQDPASSQTMYESIRSCTTDLQSLGRGDMTGMLTLYGAR